MLVLIIMVVRPYIVAWLARWADFKQLFAILSIVVVVFISKFYDHRIIMWQNKVSLHLRCHVILIDNAVLLIKNLRRQQQATSIKKNWSQQTRTIK